MSEKTYLNQKDVKHLQKLVGELMISQFTTQSQYKAVIDTIFESYMKGKQHERTYERKNI